MRVIPLFLSLFFVVASVLQAAPGRELFSTRMGATTVTFVRGNVADEESGGIFLEIGNGGGTGLVGEAFSRRVQPPLDFETRDRLP